MMGLIRGKWRTMMPSMLFGALLGLYLGFLIFEGDITTTSRITSKNKKDQLLTNSHEGVSTADYSHLIPRDRALATTHLEADSIDEDYPEPLGDLDQEYAGASIVFLKTHKTGSSTVASILQRYGYSHNMTFLVPTIGSLVNYVEKFSSRRITDPKWRSKLANVTSSARGYELLTNHARYDRQEMSAVFNRRRKARYVTILREPVAQFESAFYYFDIPDALPADAKTLGDFMTNPMRNFVEVQKKNQYVKYCVYNEQLFDFGLDHADMFSSDVVEAKIAEIDEDFDLVMLCEYFDESLVLLRRLLDWSMDDMVYLVKGARASKFSHKDELTPELRAKIRAWNAGDEKLYAHFNRTFWRKVAEYGPTFSADLAELKGKLADAVTTCFNTTQSNIFVREAHFALRKDAPPWCKDAERSDLDFTALIRKRMKEIRVPLYDFKEKVPQRKSASAKKSSAKSKG